MKTQRYAWWILVNSPRCSLFVAIGFPSLSVKISSVPDTRGQTKLLFFFFFALGIQRICTLFADQVTYTAPEVEFKKKNFLQ